MKCQLTFFFIGFCALSLHAFNDTNQRRSIEKEQQIDEDKPLRKMFTALMYAGELKLFKRRMPLLEELSYSTVQRLLRSCRLGAGAVELMIEQSHQLPDLLLAIDELYVRSPTLQQVQSKEAYVHRKIKEVGSDEMQKKLWEMIKEISALSLRRIMKIKQAADAAGEPCNKSYLATMLEKLYALEPLLEYESNQYIDAIDDNYEFVEHRKGHVYITPLDRTIAVRFYDDTTQESEAMYQMMRRIVAQRTESDVAIFKTQLKELAESDLTGVYRLRDTLKGCQYGNRVLAAYDPAIVRGALEVMRGIDDMETYASTDECYDVSGRLHRPISDFIVAHSSLERLSARREWKYIFCAEKVIARMQEPADRADCIHADWQHLRTLEYAIADELLLWHPKYTMEDSDCEAIFSITMERMDE